MKNKSLNTLKSSVIATAVLTVLSACGGGDSGASTGASSSPPATPAPIVKVELLDKVAHVGQTTKIYWTATNATSCQIPSLSATQTFPIDSQNDYTPTSGGVKTITVQCTGAGGTTSSSVTLTVPMPVYTTSYENRHKPRIDDPTTPPIALIPSIQKEFGEQDVNGRSIAFADFMQNGSYDTAIISTTISYGVDTVGGVPIDYGDTPSKLYFVQKDQNGKWADVSEKLFENLDSRYTCFSSSFMVVADFNNDKRPDVYVSCHGKDYDPDVIRESDLDGLSYQYLVLSQPSGKYSVQRVGNRPIYGHSAIAADFNKDGNVDVASVDTSCNPVMHAAYFSCKPFVMWGNGDGTFIEDLTVFPEDSYNRTIYSIMSVIIKDELYVILSGLEEGQDIYTPYGYENTYGTKSMQFIDGKFRYVDLNIGHPKVARTGRPYGFAFDTVYHNGAIYSLRLDGLYEGEGYIKHDLATSQTTVLLSRRTAMVDGVFYSGNPGLLQITTDNRLIGMMSGCNPADPKYKNSACSVSIPLN